VGSFQESKALDRASKLHGYRINAYVRLGSKRGFDLLPMASDPPLSTDILRVRRHISKVPIGGIECLV
jgi:hypothetical protein